MDYRIPFNYKKFNEYLTLATLNEGLTICKRLGLEPVKIIVGLSEWHQMKAFAATGISETGIKLVQEILGAINVKLTRNNYPSDLSFICRYKNL